MQYFTKTVYWALQTTWWLSTTFVLRYPSTDYFDKPEIMYPYLMINFLICISFTHYYAYLYRKKNCTGIIAFGKVTMGILITGGAVYLLDYYFGFQRYRKPSMGLPLIAQDYLQFFVESIRYVGLWFLVYHLIIGNSQARLRAIALAHSETDLKTAELENLKSQLNPHFLFNAINSIKALTISDPMVARNALTQLSQLLRTSLTVGNQQLITLETEIEFVKDYLFLEKIRYENRLCYSFDIDENSLNLRIPPMSLQLLVENAIKHGIGRSKIGGVIMIKSVCSANNLTLSVVNSGKLKQSPTKNDTGVGIKNLQKRLFFNFQENAMFNVSEEENQVIASIFIKNAY